MIQSSKCGYTDGASFTKRDNDQYLTDFRMPPYKGLRKTIAKKVALHSRRSTRNEVCALIRTPGVYCARLAPRILTSYIAASTKKARVGLLLFMFFVSK